jgi:hypothetical protein
MNSETKKSILELIDSTFIITDAEKQILKLKLRQSDPLTTRILLQYHQKKDVADFYNLLKENNLLSSQSIYKEYIDTYKSIQSPINNSQSLSKENSPSFYSAEKKSTYDRLF